MVRTFLLYLYKERHSFQFRERKISNVMFCCWDPITHVRCLENNIQFLFTLTSLKYFLFLLAVGIVTCLISNQSILSSKLGYIGEFEIIDDHRSNKIVIELTGRLNKCGVISPRFDVEYGEIEKWIVNLLPSRQFGHIILSTTYGIMTHEEARRKKTGGKILGFFY
jgi:ribosomal protein S8